MWLSYLQLSLSLSLTLSPHWLARMMNMYYPGTAGRVVILDEMIEQRLPNMTGFPSNKL